MHKLTTFRHSLSQTAAAANDWFYSATIAMSREVYFSRGKLGDDGSGAVYVYFDETTSALYAGESSRPIKRRMHDKTSPHKTTEWWESWKTVRFLQVQNQTDRLTLELLLILAMKPKYNSKPGVRLFDSMFERAKPLVQPLIVDPKAQ